MATPKLLVFTVNINNYLSQNARESLVSAANRWGADYLEVTSVFDKRLYPSFAKICSFNKIESYDRVVYFDSDMLISSNAPSPFLEFQDYSKMIAVLDIHPQNHDHESEQWKFVKNNVQNIYYDILESQFGFGVPRDRYLDNFFNSGFFVISPKRHKPIFRLLESSLPLTDDRINYCYSAHYEQALFNYIVQSVRFKDLYLADESWNRLEPPIEQQSMKGDNVWHFTGYSFFSKKDIIKTYDWGKNL